MKRLDPLNFAGALFVLIATGLLPIASRPATATEGAPRVRIGVAGLTHSHVHQLLRRADRGDVEIVGMDRGG